MLGPGFGNFAASVVALLLAEKASMDYLLPLLIPTIEMLEAAWGKFPFALASGAAISILSFWGIGGLMVLPAIFRVESWKIQLNRSLDTKMLLRSLPLISFNFWFGTTLASWMFFRLLPESSSDWRRLPTMATVARDAVVWLLVQEVLFFYCHKTFHENKVLYARIHKLHHTWTSPVAITAIYCNPIEHIVCNVFPVVLGPILCGSHLAAIGVFLFGGLVHTCAVHSGYWICDDNGIHDEHHRKFNVNYGVSGFLDVWYGTYQLPPGAAGVTFEVPAPAATKKSQ